MKEYLGDLGIVLLLLVLIIIVLPILCGWGIGLILGMTGLFLYGIVILVSVVIWTLLYYLWWL